MLPALPVRPGARGPGPNPTARFTIHLCCAGTARARVAPRTFRPHFPDVFPEFRPERPIPLLPSRSASHCPTSFRWPALLPPPHHYHHRGRGGRRGAARYGVQRATECAHQQLKSGWRGVGALNDPSPPLRHGPQRPRPMAGLWLAYGLIPGCVSASPHAARVPCVHDGSKCRARALTHTHTCAYTHTHTHTRRQGEQPSCCTCQWPVRANRRKESRRLPLSPAEPRRAWRRARLAASRPANRPAKAARGTLWCAGGVG